MTRNYPEYFRHLQWAHLDPGAPQGFAFSAGLALALGS